MAALDQMQGARKTKLWFFWPYLTYIFSLQDLATPCFLSNFTFLLQIHGHPVIQISDISEISQSSFLLPSNYSSLEKTIIYVFIRSLFENTILWILLQTYKEVMFVGKPWQRVFMNMMIFLCFSRKIWWMISSYYWYWKETSIHVKNHHMVGVDFNQKPSYPTFMVTSRN